MQIPASFYALDFLYVLSPLNQIGGTGSWPRSYRSLCISGLLASFPARHLSLSAPNPLSMPKPFGCFAGIDSGTPWARFAGSAAWGALRSPEDWR